MTQFEEDISAVVGLLVVVIIFILGVNMGLFTANYLREFTWHSSESCPSYTRESKIKKL